MSGWVAWVRDFREKCPRWRKFAPRETWTEAQEMAARWVAQNDFGKYCELVVLWWAWGSPSGPVAGSEQEWNFEKCWGGGAPAIKLRPFR